MIECQVSVKCTKKYSSIVSIINCFQVNYAADAITKMINTGAKSMVLKPEILKNYVEYVKQHMTGEWWHHEAVTSQSPA